MTVTDLKVKIYGDGADAWAAASGRQLAERCEKHGETVFCYARDAHALLANLVNHDTGTDFQDEPRNVGPRETGKAGDHPVAVVGSEGP